MRNSVKICVGLSMPALALAAFWLWRLSKARDRDNDMNEERGALAVREVDNSSPSGSDISDTATDDNLTIEKTQETSSDLKQALEFHTTITNATQTDHVSEVETKFGNASGGSDTGLGTKMGGEYTAGDGKEIEYEKTERPPAEVAATASQEVTNVAGNQEASERKRNHKLEKTVSLTSSVGSAKESLSDSNGSTSGSASDELKLSTEMNIGDFCDDGVEHETWEIEFPQALCGRLIGKKGKNVQKISQTTGTKIRLIPQKENSESSQRLVSITGSPTQLSLALNALQEKFPSVPFRRLNGTNSTIPPLMGDTAHIIVLPEHGMFQVIITSIVDANHFYVQLVDQMQTSQMMLQQLDQQMYQYYGQQSQATIRPQGVSAGLICASYNQSGWWRRAQVVGLLMKPDEVEVTWVDYGGKETVPTNSLRHIRQEFLQLPFQAVECYLSNVVPHQGESSFSMTACALFEGLTQNCVITARITSYNKDCPCLELYVAQCQWTGQSILVNRELVRRGYARWSET